MRRLNPLPFPGFFYIYGGYLASWLVWMFRMVGKGKPCRNQPHSIHGASRNVWLDIRPRPAGACTGTISGRGHVEDWLDRL